MSRYEITMKDGNTFAYGYDPPMATYFWQIFNNEPENVGGRPIVDEGGMRPRSGGEFLTAVNQHGVEDLVKEDHIHMAAMDLPF